MRSTRAGLLFACALLAVGVPAAAQLPSDADWQARQGEALRRSESILQRAAAQEGLLAQYQLMRDAYKASRDPVFRRVFGQYLSWYQSFIGDYPAAAASFSIRQLRLPQDNPSPLSLPGDRARSALEAIPELARNRQAVFFNEAHNVPLTRSLTVQLLGKLRAEGFDYFAAETLSGSDTRLQSRGYPIRASGFYTREPIAAEMVRTALKLGFKVIAYEAGPDLTGDAREAEQAANLYHRVFQKDPGARLVVNAGYAHIQESGDFLGGSSMAEHLRKLSGIDPLTVEQTVMYAHPSAADDHPYYAAVMHELQPKLPIVFEDKTGQPWTLRTGYDVSVFFPPEVLRHGRPEWLRLGGLRQPYYISGNRCLYRYPCLVEARYADEGDDAIPADRLVLDPAPLTVMPQQRMSFAQAPADADLYLRPGKYRLTYVRRNGHVAARENITVQDRQR